MRLAVTSMCTPKNHETLELRPSLRAEYDYHHSVRGMIQKIAQLPIRNISYVSVIRERSLYPRFLAFREN